MANNTKNKKLEQVENYVKSQNDESNKHWKIISGKLLILITITFIVPYILLSIDRWYFDFDINDDYKIYFVVIIYFESFFTYLIKKIIPRINLGYVWSFIALILSYQYRTWDWWDRMIALVILFFSPLLCGISYFGCHFITTLILTIQHVIKKENIYDDEMKKICKWLWIGLIILFVLLTIYFFIYFQIK